MRILFLLWMNATLSAQQPLPEAPAKSTVERVCAACHDLGTATGTRRTKAGWDMVVDAMANRGARASDQEFDAIVAYLAKYFGVVNINQASAKQIEEVLEISSQQAEAILQHRTGAGDFKNLDALKKVPGVDAALLEERKDRIVFQ